VSFPIRPLPAEFSLPEVYAVADPLHLAFPNNNHVRAKIRQSLQILRDRGDIAFDGNGRYRKLRLVQERSVHIDFSIAEAAYGPMLRRLSENGCLPDYLIVSYDRPRSIVLRSTPGRRAHSGGAGGSQPNTSPRGTLKTCAIRKAASNDGEYLPASIAATV
jgi:hypothetical protein